MQKNPLSYMPNSGVPMMPYNKHVTAAEFREEFPGTTWQFNPWTGSPRRRQDQITDPLGLLIVPPGQGSSIPAAHKQAGSALDVQEGGGHYKALAVQPAEYVHANNIPYLEGSVIYYVTRWRSKNGIDDLRKARHTLDLLIELETRKAK